MVRRRSRFPSLDLRSHRAQPLIDPLVAPLDLADVVDHGVAVGGQGREQHRHAGPDVRTLHHAPVQRGGSGDHGAVRVAQHDARAHPDQLVHEEEARLEQLLEHQQDPLALRRNHDRDRHQIGGEGGPRAVLQLRHVPAQVGANAALLTGIHDQLGAVESRADAQSLEPQEDAAQILAAHAVDRDRAVRHGGEPDERADFDVVRPHRAAGGPEWQSAFDRERVRADALDARAQVRQEAGEVLDVRLAGGVPQGGGAAGGHRRHQRVLGRRDAGFVEENVGPGKGLRLELVGGADGDLRAEPLEGEEMRVHAPPADHVAARRRETHSAEARQHRAGQEDRRADAGAQGGVELARLGPRGIDLHRVGPQPADLGAEMRQQGQHRLDVADVRHVVDPAGPIGEQRRRQDGKGRILVAGRVDRALQGAAASDRKGRGHGSAKLCGGLRRRQAFANVRDVNVSPVLALAGLAAIGLLATRLPPIPWRHVTSLDLVLAAGGPLVLLGLVLGPGIDLINRPVLDALAPVAALAIGWIGAALGARFEWRYVRRIGRGAWLLAALSAAAAFAAVTLGAWLLGRLVPALATAWTPRLPVLLTLGAAAAASGPGAVTLVARAVGVRKRATRAFSLAAALENACGTIVFLSLTRARPERADVGFLLLATLLFGAGVGYAAELSPLLVCGLATALIVSASPRRHAVRRVLAEWEPPIYAVFLVIAGAVLTLPTVWILVAVPLLAAARAAAKWAALRYGSDALRLGGISPNGGLGSVAQGAAAIAMGLNFFTTYGSDGTGASSALLTTIVLGVAAAQLAAPPLMLLAVRTTAASPAAPAPLTPAAAPPELTANAPAEWPR